MEDVSFNKYCIRYVKSLTQNRRYRITYHKAFRDYSLVEASNKEETLLIKIFEKEERMSLRKEIKNE